MRIAHLLGLVAMVTLASTTAAQESQLEVVIAAPTDSAITRTEAAMANAHLSIASVQGPVVTGTYTDGPLAVEIRATVIAVDSARSRVVITGFGSAPAMFGMPKTRAQVTSATGGKGKKAWAKMQQLAAALASATS